MVKIMVSACRINKLGHSGLVSGFVGDLANRYLNAKFEVSTPSGYKMHPVNGRPDRWTAGRMRMDSDHYSSAEL